MGDFYTKQFKTQIAKEVLNAKKYSDVAKKYGVDRSCIKNGQTTMKNTATLPLKTMNL